MFSFQIIRQTPLCTRKLQYTEDVLVLNDAPFPEEVWGNQRIPPGISNLGIRQRQVSISSPSTLSLWKVSIAGLVIVRKNIRPCRESKLNFSVFQPSRYTNPTTPGFHFEYKV
jgi:hypothetical protein